MSKEAFVNKITRYGEKPASEFMANPNNPRKHPEKQRKAVKASLRTLGWIAPVIELSNGYLLDGHERIWQALQMGDDTPVPYIVVDLDEQQARQALATFDYITYMAEYDKDTLAGLVQELNDKADADIQAVLDEMATEYQLEMPEEFKEYDESIADDVEMITCPHCGERFPK